MVISDEGTSASKVLVLKWSLTKMHSQIKICSKTVKSVAYDPECPTGGTSETKTNSCTDHTFVFHIQPETLCAHSPAKHEASLLQWQL